MDVEGYIQFILDQQAQFSVDIAQIHSVLGDVATTQQRTGEILETLAQRQVATEDAMRRLADEQSKTEEAMRRLAEKQSTTEENLNALLLTVERHITNH